VTKTLTDKRLGVIGQMQSAMNICTSALVLFHLDEIPFSSLLLPSTLLFQLGFGSMLTEFYFVNNAKAQFVSGDI